MRCTLLTSLLSLAVLCASATAAPIWVPTNFGAGADAEVRESNPTQNRGTSTEIASRIKNAVNATVDPGADGGDRNSLIYVKIDLTNAQMPADGKTAFRMTYRNSSLSSGRVEDYITPNSNLRTGMAFYGLDPSLTWDESTLSYLNAPGMTPDGDVGTRDLNGDLEFLGTATFPALGTQNHLPIGGELKFESENLDAFVQASIDAGESEVTLVSHVLHDGGPFFSQFGNWINFNYLFNPKEQVTLNGDNYDAGDGNGNIGNLFSTDNSTGDFSPALLLVQVPEPTTSILFGLALTAGLARRRRA